MARAQVIEEESGTSRGHVHPHNGYYAGDFSSITDRTPDPAALSSPYNDGGPDASLRLPTPALAGHKNTRPYAA